MIVLSSRHSVFCEEDQRDFIAGVTDTCFLGDGDQVSDATKLLKVSHTEPQNLLIFFFHIFFYIS